MSAPDAGKIIGAAAPMISELFKAIVDAVQGQRYATALADAQHGWQQAALVEEGMKQNAERNIELTRELAAARKRIAELEADLAVFQREASNGTSG